MRKQERRLWKLARRYRRRVELVKKGHFRLVCERGQRPTIYCASTPRCADHWIREVERDLRRYNKDC